MKKNFWKKTAAGLMALLIVAGVSPVAPFSQALERTAITASAQGTNVDLADITGVYTAQDGEVLTGSTEYTVNIANGASITLSDATINGGIVCEGSATITVAGSNNVTGLEYHAGIRVGAPDTTLTINGNGVLNATGGDQGAGIGLDSSYDSNSGNYSSQSGGNIVIEGGTINATGAANAAGIGCGCGRISYPGTIEDITIKGGTVTAVGQNKYGGYGIGKGGGYNYNQNIGTITITTAITTVDASGSVGSFSNDIVYKDGDVDVTASKDTYFAISDEGNRRLISTDLSNYSISIEDNIQHGVVTASKTSAISGASITLSAMPDYGYRLKSITVTDSAQNTISLNGMSFIMPAGNVTVSAVFEEIPITQTNVNYIDADGNEQTVTASVLDADTTELTEGWYVVDSTITIYDTLLLNGNVNIILVDDRTMTINSGNNDAIKNYETGSVANLTIYGQSKGTGNIILNTHNGGGSAISGCINGTLTINGGGLLWNESLSIVGTDPAQEIFTLNAGRIARNNGFGDPYKALDIRNGKGSIKGGQVDLNIYNRPAIDLSNSELTLGYTKATDYIRINAGSFFEENGSVSIAEGKTFTDGTNIYDSNTPSDTLRALSGVTLTPASARNVDATDTENGKVNVPRKAFVGDTVTLNVAPADGYVLKSLTVKDSDENVIEVENNQFTMPDGNVTVTAEFDKPISSASLTLGDDLGLNFYMSSAITDENAADYTVKFEGECLENEATLTKNESTGKYYATAHVYAKNLDKKITAKLYKGEEVICTTEYSVSDYLEKAPETVTDEKALALIKATKAFGAMSADYFYEGEHGFSAAYNEYLTQSGLTDADIVNNAKNNYATEFTTDDAKISLVLDEKTAIRLYVKGVQPDGGNLKPSKQANKDVYPSYYEIAGLTPDKLADEQTVTIGGVDYKFSALSWANRILNQENPSEKNLNMAKAVTAYYLAAHYYYLQNHPVDLSALTENYEAMDGEVLTGILGAKIKISIADDATIILRDVTINGEHDDEDYQWAGITCNGDAKLILEGTNTIKGFYWNYPGVYIAPEKTLTIDGTGSLNASSNGSGAGIGGGYKIKCGNIVIDGGVINATGGVYAAGIGSGEQAKCGDIIINGGTVTAIGQYYSPGIGGGGNAECGNININGGTVTATGGHYAPGIGSILFSECGNITIADTVTKVTAIMGEEATICIGAGNIANCGTVTIGGNVYYENGAYVNGGDTYLTQDEIVYPAPIDLSALTEDYEAKDGDTLTGTLGENVKISIADGATVTLKDVTINGVHDVDYQWAGITCNGNAKLILEGENNVKGFYENYPGIFVPVDKTLTIDGTGSLNASSNGWGAGIGGGYEINCGNIIIEGGTVTANGGDGAAGIGGAQESNCGDITINGGTVIANGGEYAAGIGNGNNGNCGNIIIADTVTKVTAIKGEDAQNSIGGGYGGSCGTVTIAEGANVEQN